jgi:hypothetical protein
MPDVHNSVERAICANELFFPHPLLFNDPFDCRPAYSFEASDAEWRAYLKPQFQRRTPLLSESAIDQQVEQGLKNLHRTIFPVDQQESLKSKFEQQLRSTGVFSLSARNDHILLWSHYASSHQGVCLGFAHSTAEAFFGRALEVNYELERPVVNPIRESALERFKKTILTKSSMWDYEKEWRVIEYGNGPGIYKFQPELLRFIILGAAISNDHKNKILEWVSRRKTKLQVLQASFDRLEFKINLTEVA